MTTTIKFTRQDYLSDKCTHEQYYSQFITDGLIDAVKRRWTIEQLNKAFDKGKHLNSLPLAAWDDIAYNTRSIVTPLIKECGDFWSLAGGVCAAKAAARQIISNI